MPTGKKRRVTFDEVSASARANGHSYFEIDFASGLNALEVITSLHAELLRAYKYFKRDRLIKNLKRDFNPWKANTCLLISAWYLFFLFNLPIYLGFLQILKIFKNEIALYWQIGLFAASVFATGILYFLSSLIVAKYNVHYYTANQRRLR